MKVSESSDGTGGNASSFGHDVSADGRLVLFGSDANNLVSGDTNGAADLFVKSVATGAVRRVSTSANGAQSNHNIEHQSALSPNGRYVVFVSHASNLVADDTNQQPDIFLKDLRTGQMRRVSVAAGGTESNAFSRFPSLSANGRYVAFSSAANNLVPGDVNNSEDVFIKDMVTGTLQSFVGGKPQLSSDGQSLAFHAWTPSTGMWDVYVLDVGSGVVTLVSASPRSGTSGNQVSDNPGISADGRHVVFTSLASDLVSGDTNNLWDVFVLDRDTETLVRASTSSADEQGNYGVDNYFDYAPTISMDGRYVAFASLASNLEVGDTNRTWDVFVKDLETGELARVSVAADGTEANGESKRPIISDDGRYIVFSSWASNLVANDSYGWDVFRVVNPLK